MIRNPANQAPNHPRSIAVLFAAIVATALLWLSPAAAEDQPTDTHDILLSNALLHDMPHQQVVQPKLTATLLADHPELTPGQQVRVGLLLQLAPEHYIYWKGPAATVTDDTTTTGTPTDFQLTSPPGFDTTPQPWPIPKRKEKKLSETHTEDLFLYEDQVMFDAIVRVPITAKPGESATFTATASWLLCENTCQPGQVEVSLSLPITTHATAADPAWSLPFQRADTLRPLPSVPQGYNLTAQWTQQTAHPNDHFALILTLQPPQGVSLQPPHLPTHAAVMVERTSDSLHPKRATAAVTDDGQLRAVIPFFSDEYTQSSASPIAIKGIFQAQITKHSTTEMLSFAFDTTLTTDTNPSAALNVDTPQNPESSRAPLPLWQALLFALVGGLILNVMPCVLPVLSLKSLALVELAKESDSGIKKHALAYTLGVLSSFWLLAAVIIALQSSGNAVGWGFQFQNPAFVTVIAAVIFASSLSLFGVFELPGLSISVNTQTPHNKTGLATSFSHGLLATALSTPCSAPLLGGALAFALTQPPALILLIMTTVGLGLASPVVMLAIFPRSRKLLPRPGLWMESFKKIVGFLMLATTLWLLNVLSVLVNTKALMEVLTFLAVLSAAAWTWGNFAGPLATPIRKIVVGTTSIAMIIMASWQLSLDHTSSANSTLESDYIAWKPFKGDDTIALVEQGQTIFIDFTAEWCLSCKAFEASVIETEPVADAIRKNNVLSFKADWTRNDLAVTKWLNQFGGVAVPLYVVLPAGKPQSPIIMADSITQSELLRAIDTAGPSTQPAPKL